MIKRLFIILIIFLVPAIGWASVITCSTMVADNSTDNTAALNTCITSAQSETEKTVEIPTAADYYKLTGYFTIPENIVIQGEEGAKLNAQFRMSDGSEIINFTFSGGAYRIYIGEIGQAPDEYIDNVVVRDCEFTGSTASPLVLGARVNDSVFDNNTFANDTGSNLQILGGKRNVVTNNTITDGKTAIIFKYDAAANGGGPDSMIHGNIVMGNTVSGFSEEGISFDMEGSATTSQMFLERDTIESINGGNVTLSSAGWGGGDDPDYVGMKMIFVDGDLIGTTRTITVQSNAVFTIDGAALSANEIGDIIVIAATFEGNIIAYNEITSSGKSSILLYGMAFLNRIYENTLSRGNIGIKSLNNTREPDTLVDGNVTSTCGTAPTGYNLVSDNDVGTDATYCAANTGNCRMDSFYREPTVESCTGAWPTYITKGNSFTDNLTDNGLYVAYQKYYVDGNVSSSISTAGTNTALSLGDVSGLIDFSAPTCVGEGLQCGDSCNYGAVTDLDDTCAGATVCCAEAVPPVTPTITVSVSDSSAEESGTTTGSWTLNCSPTCSSVSVTYALSGTANAETTANGCDTGDDYTLTSLTTIVVDGTSQVVTITACDDALNEVYEEIATLTVTDEAAYNVGTPASGNIGVYSEDAGMPIYDYGSTGWR